MAKPFPLAEQIAAVDREVAMREQVYPTRVAAKKMAQAAADRELAVMRNIRATLVFMREHETTIRRAIERERAEIEHIKKSEAFAAVLEEFPEAEVTIGAPL